MLIDYVDYSKLVWSLSLSLSLCFTLVVLKCVCGCRKKVPKNELMGLAGLVKITNPDENVNFNADAQNVQLNSVSVSSDEYVKDDNQDVKRNSTGLATATRSLPDLPVDSGDVSEKNWDPPENNVDTNSDLYATVEDARRKKRPLTSGLTVDSSYTPSQTDDSLSPYARLKGEHAYDQLQKNEHPYAQVGPNGGPRPSTSQDTTVNSSTSRLENSGDNRSKSPSLSEVVDDIPAASAIAGSVPANHDLPYMTPPIPVQHFSGDSQDSSKGYTSISVREPLARILAARRGDSHYATVSDDSDEMYAAIEDRNAGEYTSGSETYAQIAPVHPPPLTLNLSEPSTSGAGGNNLGSPRRERRQANSPLPQLPPPLDDMYAKVVKKRSPTTPEPPQTPPPPPLSAPPTPTTADLPRPSGPESSLIIPGYESVNIQEGVSDSDPNYEELQPHMLPLIEPDYASLSRRYESLEGGDFSLSADPNYESVGCKSSDPNYESVGNRDPPYEKVQGQPEEPPDYELVCRMEGQGMTSIQDLYAQVNKSPTKR